MIAEKQPTAELGASDVAAVIRAARRPMRAKEIARVLRDVQGRAHVQKSDVNRVLDSHEDFDRGTQGTWTLVDDADVGGAADLDASGQVPAGQSGDALQLWEEVLGIPGWESKLAYLPTPERQVLRRRQPMEPRRGGRRRQLPLSQVARALALDPDRPLRLSHVKTLERLGLRRLLALGTDAGVEAESTKSRG